MGALREIGWDGFYNTRDLGGLPTKSGGMTRHGAFIRSASLVLVADDGWRVAREAGLRTIVDLRTAGEIRDERGVPPAEWGFARVEVSLDGTGEGEFWTNVRQEGLDGSPLYYRPFLDRMPERCAAVITALANTAPDTVLFHCAAGRDRTGLVTLLLLSLADVSPEEIAADYELSATALVPMLAALDLEDPGPLIEAHLRCRGTTLRAVMLETLATFDAERYLLDAGVSASDIDVVRRRLIA